jgi:hypothetical protein
VHWRALVLIASAVLAAGCSHGGKQVKTSACARARTEAAHQRGDRALRGDVDGDGRADSVSLVRLRGDSRCGAFLVVRTGSRTLTHAMRTTPSVPPVPSLNGLAALGSRAGLVIVVTTWEGASTEFARVFAVRDGRISPLATETPDGTFPYQGSVTHLNAIDCAGALVVASGWFLRNTGGRSFGFYRRFYRIGDGRFALVRSERGASRSFDPTQHLREFREPQPFPSCMRVRATP